MTFPSSPSRRRLPTLLALAAFLLVSGLRAAPPRPEQVSDPRITAPEILAHVRYLASDELQGRASGTAGNNRAAGYLAGRFRAAGLRPAGEGGSFFQTFPVFTGVRLGEGNKVTLKAGPWSVDLRPAAEQAEAGGRAPVPVQPGASGDFLPLSFSGNGSASGSVVFAGYGISKPELGYDDYQGLEVRSKMVIVLRHTPDGDDNGKFGPYARLTYKTMTAREKGAAGILLLTGPLNDQPEDLGVFRLESASADCGIPAAIVKREWMEKLVAPKTLRDLQIALAHGQARSFPIPGARVSMRINVVRQVARTRNVLGFLGGSDPKLKDEVVVVGAHYDHLGLSSAHSLSGSNKPEIHHGADDNASGTAGVLELAQYFAAHREKLGRSLLFMAFSGEELGLLGSNYWTKHPTIPLGRIAAMINLDMIGRLQNDTVQVLGSGTSPAWQSLLDEANRTYKFQLKAGDAALSGFGGSDQQSFYAKEIPVLFFFTGVHPDYHKPSDTWEKINADGEAKLLELVADVIGGVSRQNSRPRFTRAKEAEQSSGPGFRVYLGTIPDYAEAVEGVALQGVREGSPAEKAGLRAGDVIVEFEGKKIRSVEEYSSVLSGAKPNVPVTLVVLRKGQRVTLTVTPLPRRN